jgi:hypothetical protein
MEQSASTRTAAYAAFSVGANSKMHLIGEMNGHKTKLLSEEEVPLTFSSDNTPGKAREV